MPLSDILLGTGDVLVTSVSTISPTTGLTSVDGKTLFGYVSAVYDSSDTIVVGNVVMFESAKARTLLYGSTQYYLVNEENISGSSVPPP